MYTVIPPEYIPQELKDKFFLFDGKCKVVEGLPKDILGDGNLRYTVLGMVGPYKAFVVGASVTGLSMPKFFSQGAWFADMTWMASWLNISLQINHRIT